MQIRFYNLFDRHFNRRYKRVILITKETVTLKLSELIIELSFYDFLGAQQVVVLIL